MTESEAAALDLRRHEQADLRDDGAPWLESPSASIVMV